jgi:hypothetical protein
MNFEPWQKYPALSRERLITLAMLIRDARRGAVELHDPAGGDDEWSLGCRAYSRTCHALKAATRQYDWLKVLPDCEGRTLRFTFAIEGVPLRFYRGDPADPPSKCFSASFTELGQMTMLAELGTIPSEEFALRLAIETDKTGNASQISLVELLLDQQDVIFDTYLIPLTAKTSVVPLQPKGIDLPPPTVEPLKVDDDEIERRKRDAS